jgi:hypothetical protein
LPHNANIDEHANANLPSDMDIDAILEQMASEEDFFADSIIF